uniref:Uncharacterized protein n=1 Tax=Racemicystis crocea TaxID=1707966 RepID=A0A3S7V0Q8_9BACT|nr:hypothetical protein [Racemicystis crocea]
MRQAISIALATALFTATIPALAQPPSRALHLTYSLAQGTETCPSERGFRHIIATHFAGRDPFTGAGAERIAITITRHLNAFHAEIAHYAADGHQTGVRRLQSGTTCNDLIGQVATALDFLLSPPIPPPASDTPPPLPAPTLDTPALPQLAPAPTADTAPAPSPPSRGPRPLVGLGAALPMGTVPAGITAGFSAFAGLRWETLSLNLEARADLPGATSVQFGGGSGERRFIGGSVVPCAHYRRIFGCGVATIGIVTSDGTNGAHGDHNSPNLLLGGRFGIEAPLPITKHLFAQLTGDLLVPVARYRIRINDSEVWEPDAVSWMPALRLLAIF